MKMRMLLIVLLMWTQVTSANVAVTQLNTLLLEKEAAHTEVSKPPSPQVKHLADNYYFVFIYRATCPHCHQLAPVLKDFSDTFHVKVTSYSLDGEAMDAFESQPLSPELFRTFYVLGGYKATVPALFLVNRHTLEAYAVLFGEATPYQLARRVSELMQHIEEKFHD